jgi:hypothetical protein
MEVCSLCKIIGRLNFNNIKKYLRDSIRLIKERAIVPISPSWIEIKYEVLQPS